MTDELHELIKLNRLVEHYKVPVGNLLEIDRRLKLLDLIIEDDIEQGIHEGFEDKYNYWVINDETLQKRGNDK